MCSVKEIKRIFCLKAIEEKESLLDYFKSFTVSNIYSKVRCIFMNRVIGYSNPS